MTLKPQYLMAVITVAIFGVTGKFHSATPGINHTEDTGLTVIETTYKPPAYAGIAGTNGEAMNLQKYQANTSVSAAPEVGIGTLLLVVLGLIGMRLRRRDKKHLPLIS